MNIQPHECLKRQIHELQDKARCNNRSFRDLVLCSIDDPIVRKLGREIKNEYLFRIHLLRIVGELTVDDCFCDMVTLDTQRQLLLEDLCGFCWCCALRQEGKECHHPQKAKCEWWQWDGFRRLNQMEEDVGSKPCCWWRKVLRRWLSKLL